MITNKTNVSVTFSFSGALRFSAPEKIAIDIFSYNSLPYSGLIVRMDFEPPASQTKPEGRPDRILARWKSYDCESAGRQPGQEIPDEASAVLFVVEQDNPAEDTDTAPVKDGYVPVTCDANSDTPLAKQIYGLDFTLNLGTLGEFASNAGINVNLLLAWSTEKQVKVFLKFPGVSGASADLFSLQGVVTFGASKYELVYTADQENNGVKGWMLMLKEMGLRIPRSGSLLALSRPSTSSGRQLPRGSQSRARMRRRLAGTQPTRGTQALNIPNTSCRGCLGRHSRSVPARWAIGSCFE